jgi:hypothetical protein
MKFFILSILILFANSCGKNTSSANYQRNPEWVLADEVYNKEIGIKVFSKLKKEKKLHVCESGWSLRGKNKIQIMHCGFDYYNEISLEKARELLLEVGNLYLNTINENKRIRPSLGVYPFNSKNIQVDIFIRKQDGSKLESEKLHVISIHEGQLEYMNHDLESELLQIIYKETYEEAATKVNDTLKRIDLLHNL